MYGPDKPGEEAKENARVWNVYLDEAENHDADMIQGFRSIIDSLLVFAALFSAVVTTFVVQTSQALQPDNAQITVSLLVETNQLLRAAGNSTNVNAVPPASLGPESRTHTSIDVWVNGLFFTSLALSLSTALLSVLAKQWLQAYTATVSGDAKTRALIRQLRFDGLVKWKLGEIIELLPLILHCSLAVFLVGLALYVSQLSHPICYIVVGITAPTFVFYFVSSMLPAFYMDCPYRIPFVFALVRPLLRTLWRKVQPLKMAEYNAALARLPFDDHLALNSLNWVFNHSSKRLVKEISIEGTSGLLDEWPSLEEKQNLYRRANEYLNPSSGNSYLLCAIVYSLSRLPDTYPASSLEDEIGKDKHSRLIVTLMKTFNLTSLLDDPTADFKDWQNKITNALFRAYVVALKYKNRVLSRWLLDLGNPNLFRSGSLWNMNFMHACALLGDTEDYRELVHHGMDLDHPCFIDHTALCCAARAGNLHLAIALLEQEPALISAQANGSSLTALDIAIWSLDKSHTIVLYLLDRGAQFSSHNKLYDTLTRDVFPVAIRELKLLLDCGWDRTVKDIQGRTLLDIAHSEGDNALVECLERYQTARFAPYGMISHIANEETP